MNKVLINVNKYFKEIRKLKYDNINIIIVKKIIFSLNFFSKVFIKL